MLIRKLKNLTQQVDIDRKEIILTKDGVSITLTKAEAGSISRTVFSWFQYHSAPKKKKRVVGQRVEIKPKQM